MNSTEPTEKATATDSTAVATPLRILVAEDNAAMLGLIARALRAEGHEIVEARNGFELMHWVEQIAAWRDGWPLGACPTGIARAGAAPVDPASPGRISTSHPNSPTIRPSEPGPTFTSLSRRLPSDRLLVDLIVTDLRMPMYSGQECLERLRARNDPTRVIVITAFGDEATRAAAQRSGAMMVLDKPLDLDRLREAVRGIR